MSPLHQIWRLINRPAPVRHAMRRGAALSVLVLLAGAALMTLSGWFITAAAAAGLAGAGAMFDVFRPAATIRLLAMGRTAARYGERLATHDATLRALARLRVALMGALLTARPERLARLRGARALNRLTADIEALDGVPLRVVLPLLAGGVTLAIAGAALWPAAGAGMAALVAGGIAGAALAMARAGTRAARRPARRAEEAAQAFRSRLIDLIAARDDLAMHGELDAQLRRVRFAETRRADAETALDRIERRTGFAVNLAITTVAAMALALGMAASAAGTLAPGRAAIGFFAALALAEALAPLRRGVIAQGRAQRAARRILRDLAGAAPAPASCAPEPGAEPRPEPGPEPSPPLKLRGITVTAPGGRVLAQGVDVDLAAGEWLALTGPSGAGKSTLLRISAGLSAPGAGRISAPPSLWLPQRSALIAGSVRANLRLAADADDPALADALDMVELTATLAPRGGLDAVLGPHGAGLSGGEARRLALARLLVTAGAAGAPGLLALDEPATGLDDAMTGRVLARIRRALPGWSVIAASHRPAEIALADRVLKLRAP